MPIVSRSASSLTDSVGKRFAGRIGCAAAIGVLCASTAAHGLPLQDGPESFPASDSDARALVDSTISRNTLGLVDQLDAASFEQRTMAMHRLAGLLTRQECELLLRLNTLSPEQRYRLLEVLRTTVVDRPRGAIGIEMGPGAVIRGGQPEVVISMVVEGMPASDKLKVDDRITHVDGQPVPNNTFLIDYVQLRSPGDTVTLSLRRPHRDGLGRIKFDAEHNLMCDELDVEIMLGNTTQLENPSSSNAVNQQIASAERTARGLMPQPIPLRFASGHGAGWDEPSVLDHPALRTLLDLQAALADGTLPVTAQLKQTFRGQHEQLKREAEALNLSDAEKAYLDAVVKRYEQLLDSIMNGD